MTKRKLKINTTVVLLRLRPNIILVFDYCAIQWKKRKDHGKVVGTKPRLRYNKRK